MQILYKLLKKYTAVWKIMTNYKLRMMVFDINDLQNIMENNDYNYKLRMMIGACSTSLTVLNR